MANDAEALAAVIGKRVRRERSARGWTLDDLAEVAGVSRRMIVNVEQGAANPSIAILLRLADALGVRLPSLVAPPEEAPTTLVRSGEGATLWTGPAGGTGVLLVGNAAPDAVELWEWILMPTERHRSDAHSSNTRELMQVHEGTVVVDVAGTLHRLAPGDALAFPGDVPHSYANPDSPRARFTLAVYEPGVDMSPAENPTPSQQTHARQEGPA